MSDIKLGLQLIVYGARPTTDLPGVLAEVKEVGYAGAEIGAMHPTLGTDFVLKAFADNGLAVTGIHCGYGDFTDPAKVADNIGFLQAAGSKYLICSGVADNNSLAGYEASAEVFNQVGQACRDAGLVFCYHNHAWEFKPLEGGVKGIHRLLELTCPDLVKLCTDVYWVTMGRESPRDFILRYADRAGYYHFKDGDVQGENGWIFKELGEGVVDIPTALATAREAGCDWLVCEQDNSQKEPKVSIKESLDYLKRLGC